MTAHSANATTVARTIDLLITTPNLGRKVLNAVYGG
jgi:hypothetical protein